MKRAAVLFLMCALVTPLAVAEDTATIRLEASPASVQVDGLIEVTVTIDADEYVNLGDVVLTYDPSRLRAVRIDPAGSRFTFDGLEELPQAPGRVRILRGEPHPTVPKGDGLLFCHVYFRGIGVASSTEIGVAFDGAGAEGDSAVYRDDGVPTDILAAVVPAMVRIERVIDARPGGPRMTPGE